MTRNFFEMKRNHFRKRKYNLVVFSIFLLIFLFLVSHIPLSLLFTSTTTTGGDTAAHNYPAWYLKTYLLENFKIVGWSQGWFGGFPLFQFYFPLPFLLMAILSYLIPIQVAFKLVTFLAIVSIPFGAYLFLKLLRFSRLVSITGAIVTLPFLFMESQSMWGGNILSTFAGEFTYALGIALS